MDNTIKKNFYNGLSKFNCVINNRCSYKFENVHLLFKSITNYEELLSSYKTFNKNIYKKKTIVIYTQPLDLNCGRIVAMHNLAKIINDMKHPDICAKLFIFNGLRYKNAFCEDFAFIEEAANEGAIVIYPEIISGNPLNCKRVIRWILLGTDGELSTDHYKTWGKDDLVYYFNSEKNGPEYKLLNTLYIGPFVKKTNFNARNGTCYINAKETHKYNTTALHFYDSLKIDCNQSQNDCIDIFNNFEYFISYDPYTYLIFVAAICGCVPVVHPVNGLNKQQWLQNTMVGKYVKAKGLNNLHGVAYGIEDIHHSFYTLHLVKEQWDDIVNFNKENDTVSPFIIDIENIETAKNTVKDIF